MSILEFKFEFWVSFIITMILTNSNSIYNTTKLVYEGSFAILSRGHHKYIFNHKLYNAYRRTYSIMLVTNGSVIASLNCGNTDERLSALFFTVQLDWLESNIPANSIGDIAYVFCNRFIAEMVRDICSLQGPFGIKQIPYIKSAPMIMK